MVQSPGLAGESTVARENFTPFYEQIMDSIRADIAAGRLRRGEQLPPTRVLVEKYGHSAGTVRKAIDELVKAGVLRGHQGVGVFVAE
jgi:GntR family transcriptional regulator